MDKKYIVKSICGDYAVLHDESGDELFISLFLLPQDLLEGDKLIYRDYVYFKA